MVGGHDHFVGGNYISSHSKIKLFWAPGHRDIVRIYIADELEWDRTENATSDILQSIGVMITSVRVRFVRFFYIEEDTARIIRLCWICLNRSMANSLLFLYRVSILSTIGIVTGTWTFSRTTHFFKGLPLELCVWGNCLHFLVPCFCQKEKKIVGLLLSWTLGRPLRYARCGNREVHIVPRLVS